MKRVIPLVTVGICLIGVGLMWNTLRADAVTPASSLPVQPTNTPAAPGEGLRSTIYEALPPSGVEGMPEQAQPGGAVTDQQVQDDAQIQRLLQHVQALHQEGVRFQVTNPGVPVQPTNTPAAPMGHNRSTVYQAPSSLAMAGVPEQTQSEVPVADQPVQDDAQIQRLLQHAQVLRQAGIRFQVPAPGMGVVGSASPQSPSQTCADMLLNSKMDVTEFGDGTGTVDHWSIVAQKVYYDNRPGFYNSPYYSLVMVDETDGSDTDLLDAYTDFDAFGQAFQAPSNLTSLEISYSRLYDNANSTDDSFYALWTLDEGYLDDVIATWSIGSSPSGWSNRKGTLSSSGLVIASGKSLVLMFGMFSNRTSPIEVIWLDDAQVRLCYPSGGPQKVYLPLVIKQPAPSGCTPLEPDSTTQRGSTTVGATCDGSFSTTDKRDYYSLNPNGATNIRLRMFNLPSGSNWDALIFEDAGGYPYVCHIGTPGDQAKSVDCTLSASKSYFVVVNTDIAPSKGANTYNMSVEQR